jgi:hypothetical protein
MGAAESSGNSKKDCQEIVRSLKKAVEAVHMIENSTNNNNPRDTLLVFAATPTIMSVYAMASATGCDMSEFRDM